MNAAIRSPATVGAVYSGVFGPWFEVRSNFLPSQRRRFDRRRFGVPKGGSAD